ncbi:MAG: tRNA pseudouridine(55) synthase TruB [Candidatus Omnitrophica bacterium]|jgi:tRNA pseudouridine55 synthase|nr:tRNA pseudouridine(55) synthase TruB [Candidatus Omnitrophota bacterium]
MLNGLLLIDKPILYTSHDVVDVVRRVLGERRVGHAGTLDPMATGLLVVMVGPATSHFESLSGDDKGYQGILTLGYSTATQDTEGIITSTGDAAGVTAEALEDIFSGFVGPGEQTAPLYSAAKNKGRKGYEAARRGLADTFTPPVKQINISELTLNAFANPDGYFSCRVSRGTYIRTLVSDIGQKAGVPATLTALRRTSCGLFNLSDAVTLKELRSMGASKISDHLQAQLEAAAPKLRR